MTYTEGLIGFLQMKISILSLKYNINFRDSDEGNCYAGEGTRLIKVFKNEQDAIELANKFNPIIAKAEKEKIIFPIQENNQKIKDVFGFTIDDIDNCYECKLVVETYEVE